MWVKKGEKKSLLNCVLIYREKFQNYESVGPFGRWSGCRTKEAFSFFAQRAALIVGCNVSSFPGHALLATCFMAKPCPELRMLPNGVIDLIPNPPPSLSDLHQIHHPYEEYHQGYVCSIPYNSSSIGDDSTSVHSEKNTLLVWHRLWQSSVVNCACFFIQYDFDRI